MRWCGGLLPLGVCAAMACTTADSMSGPDAAQDGALRDRKIAELDSSPNPVTGPDKLSDTGLYADFASRTIAAGIIAFTPRYPFWADGDTKSRYLYLPANTTIDTSDMDNWVFPVGTKVWKEFRVSGKLVETRLLWKARADAWWEVAYLWNVDGSDALAVPAGMKNALSTTHDVPSQLECDTCHGNVADVLIGVSAIQLSLGGAGLLSQLGAQGRLSKPPAGEFDVPGLGNTHDALAYFHGNCGHCHNDVGRLQKQTALRLRINTSDTVANKTGPYTTGIGLVMAHMIPPDVTVAIVAKDPAHSGVWVRMSTRDPTWQMPPLATKQVDATGLATIGTWINSLP